MNNKIWIINHYAGSMFFNQGGRHYWFAKFLNKKGYAPVVFACNVKHNPSDEYFFPADKLWEEHVAKEIDTPFVFIKSYTYNSNGADRIKNMYGFYHNVKKVAKEYAKIHGKPDMILASSVHPLSLVAGIQLSKYFGVKCICEVRDLWPEAIVAYSNRVTKNSLIAKLLYKGERWIYKRADALIFTQEGGADSVKENKK